MGTRTVRIVPATVPRVTVLRTDRAAGAVPVVTSAEPAVVPAARPTPIRRPARARAS